MKIDPVKQPHAALTALVDEHGLDEVLRILATIQTAKGFKNAADVLGVARQHAHLGLGPITDHDLKDAYQRGFHSARGRCG